MNDFWKSDTARIVRTMKATGNRPGVIAHWKRGMEIWVQTASGPEADAVRAWLPAWQPRPYYTAAELAPIFPVLAVVLGFRDRPAPPKGAALLANELRMAGLPHFQRGEETYFVVEQCHRAEEFACGFS
jgi:hypothetical protein